MTVQPKKLIEVALPLPEINDASAYDKMPGIGAHPKGIHQWWARLPLPSARAVLFSSVVDDPSSHPEKFPTEEAQAAERERLFGIVRDLMQKKLHDKPEVYARARAEMLAHTGGKLPDMLDPFSGGSIPLEAARLGFVAHAADLNPVAVLLNKCNLELVPRWLGQKPINPNMRGDMIKSQISRSGAWGLAEDVRYYGDVIRKQAFEKIGNLYSQVPLPREQGDSEANVIAWIWARTVASPDPARHGAHVPLISTYWLSSNKGKMAWLEPVVDRQNNTWRFDVKTGEPADKKAVGKGTKLTRGKFFCLLSEQVISESYIKNEGKHNKIGYQLIAIVVETHHGRSYLSAFLGQQKNVESPVTIWEPTGPIPAKLSGGTCVPYGFTQWKDIFSSRQLTALTTFSDLIGSVHEIIGTDAKAAGLSDDNATSYAATVTTFLALILDRCADFNNSLCRWSPSNQKVMNLFGRQAIPMVWDFAEANILGNSVGAWQTCMEYVSDCIEVIGRASIQSGDACQIDAAGTWNNVHDILVSTDPPYYDNICYAALSDFFYVWLRHTIGELYPDLFNTIVVPKAQELTAIADERFSGNKKQAKEHFESGFRIAFTTLRGKMDARFPLTVYYAFKQSDESTYEEAEDTDEKTGGVDLTTGWETLLEALLGSGFQITATWPVRASQKWRMVSMGTNALASYIVLACRARPDEAEPCTRRDFLTALKKELPAALVALQQGNIAPVDLAQAAIGPGMAVFSRYSKVVESSGKPMTVRTALGLINQILGDVLDEPGEDYDADTRWAVPWFKLHGFEEGDFGEAETFSKAKVTSINGLVEAGIVASGGGKVRLLRREELQGDWNPATDKRLTVWEATQHLIHALLADQGESGAARLLRKMPGSVGETARELAYRLHKISESNGWSAEAQAYNALVMAWPELLKLAQEQPKREQGLLE